MLPERTPAQRVQDDEDHRLAMCGLTPDERSGEELEDFKQRHFDFTIFDPTAGSADTLPAGSNGGGLSVEPVATFFASGLPRPTPHDAKQGPGGVGRSAIPHLALQHPLVPPPLQTS